MIWKIEMSRDVYILIIIFIVPFNSIINPFFYTLDEIINKIKDYKKQITKKM